MFVARMLTVVTSLRAQNRPVLDYLIHACRTASLLRPYCLLIALPPEQLHFFFITVLLNVLTVLLNILTVLLNVLTVLAY